VGKIDFTGLKLKLMSSIVAISAIQLLKAFMNVKTLSDRELMWYVVLHLVFVGSGLILALSDGGQRRRPAAGGQIRLARGLIRTSRLIARLAGRSIPR
jgi:uncharacterized membrane protein YqhA